MLWDSVNKCHRNSAEMPDIFSTHAHHKKGFSNCRQVERHNSVYMNMENRNYIKTNIRGKGPQSSDPDDTTNHRTPGGPTTQQGRPQCVVKKTFLPPTFPILCLQHQDQLAGGDVPGHARGAVYPAVLAGHVQRRVAVPVLQLQAGPIIHQALHHRGQAQVGGQVQWGLGGRGKGKPVDP